MPNPPDPLLAPLPIDLPPVERAARMPGGFSAVGATAGIKASGRQDLALVVADGGPVPAAAVFTPNRFAAAPVRLSRANLRATGGGEVTAGYARAVIATSGSANAATGPDGDADQAAIGEAVAAALGIDADPGAPPLDRRHRHAAPGGQGHGDGRRRRGRTASRRPTTPSRPRRSRSAPPTPRPRWPPSGWSCQRPAAAPP